MSDSPVVEEDPFKKNLKDFMGSDDGRKILAEVRANQATLRECDRHKVNPAEIKFGQKVTCLKCGGKMSGPDFLLYTRGYKAAGGDPNDVWPGFDE